MKIGERGQITIPKELREKYGFFPSIEIEFVPEAGGVKIQKKTKHITLISLFEKGHFPNLSLPP